ncbi:MAG: glycosyltransferase family 4 protein [Planctomycetaceae bacterium]|nr:glycosyltransferase family 4 protein [Planctomycetaceae bacterium]
MRILYDGEIYSIFRHGGVVRYFQHLIAELPIEDVPILLGNRLPDSLPAHPNLELAVKSFEWLVTPLKPLRKWLDRGYCERKWPELAPDLIHPTYYNEVARGRYDQRQVPLVLTVYDMIHERFPDQVDRRGRHSEKKRQAVERADHLLCISETTRQDLIERFNVPPEKTSVTLLAVDELFFERSEPDTLPTNANDLPYFLFVGRRDRYKNFWLLLDALAICQSNQPDRQLPFRLQVLGASMSAEELQRISELRLQSSIAWHPISEDAGLRDWYRHSLALVFPTLWEGFGLPLLEALASGTCVIGSNIPVFRELVSDGFEPFDPCDAESLAHAMERIFSQPQIREDRIARGLVHLPRYSWTATASATREIYQRLVAAE